MAFKRVPRLVVVNSIMSGRSPPLYCVVCLCVCVLLSSHLFILDVRFVDVPAGVTQEEGHTGFSPPSFCGACLNNFSREKDSAERSFPPSTVKSNFVTLMHTKNLYENGPNPFFSGFFNLMGTRMVQIRIAKSV